jgi:hypothetical protein
MSFRVLNGTCDDFSALGMSKTRGMPEVLVQIDACRQMRIPFK